MKHLQHVSEHHQHQRVRWEETRGACDGAQASDDGWGAWQQQGECLSASRTGQPQGAVTGEEEVEGIRMDNFF